MKQRNSSAGWRIVYFIQQLISWVAPLLHSLRWKILVLFIAGLFLPALYFLWAVQATIETSHLRSTELGMIDTALIVAEFISPLKAGGKQSFSSLHTAKEIQRRVFRDLTPNLQVVITDARGLVLCDTSGQWPPGTDVSAQKNIKKALNGKYGARWDRDGRERVVILNSTVPIYEDGDLSGTVTVIKTTADVRSSIWRSARELAVPGLLAFLMAVGISYLLSSYLTRVIAGLANRADRIAAGEENVELETWTMSEMGDLARAVEKMRRKLEGKAYVEEMTSAFSHELKTPLAAIRGAAEIIEKDVSASVRNKFLANIIAETDRLTDIVNNLLALSRIETLPASDAEESLLSEIAEKIAAEYRLRAESLRIEFVTKIPTAGPSLNISADQLRLILETLLDNAFQFTLPGKKVTLETTSNTLRVIDEGCGIEADLQEKVFDRFFTTTNPLTGRRGTGLGLAIVKSIAVRHHAKIELHSEVGKGTDISVIFTENS